MRLLICALLVIYFVLNTAFVKIGSAIPLKDVFLLVLCSLLFICFNRQSNEFLRLHAGLLSVFALFATLGLALTFLNKGGFSTASDGLLRFIIQALLTLFCTYVMARVIGVRFVAALLIGSALATGFVAVLQGVNFTPAWQLRELIGSLQNEPMHMTEAVKSATRPPGISLTPIIFSFHIISAYMALQFLYRSEVVTEKLYNICVAGLIVATVANATRSLLIGLLVQEAVFRVARADRKTMLRLAALVIVVGPIGYLITADSRLAEFSDASAVGRSVLYYYGLQLWIDNPFGYGWGFHASDFAWLYWEHLAAMPKSDAAYRLEIHNAFLNFLLIYGLYGVCILGMCFLYAPRLMWAILLFASGYLLNVAFHNGGIFMGDNYFWIAFGIFLAVRDVGVRVRPTAERRPNTQAVAYS